MKMKQTYGPIIGRGHRNKLKMGKITRGNISIIIKSWCGRDHTYQVTEETRRHNENEFSRELGVRKYRIGQNAGKRV